MPLRFLVALLLLWMAPQQITPQPDAIDELVQRLETAARTGDRATVAAMATEANAVGDLVDAVSGTTPTRVVMKTRDRIQAEGGGQRLLIEWFNEVGSEGRLSTWSLDLVPHGDAWKIASAARLANVSGLNRLSLNAAKQFDVRDLTMQATDMALHMSSGTAFVAETREGITAVVLLGNGELRFTPPDAAEQTQIRIFSGADSLRTPIEAAFVRLRPSDFKNHFPADALTPRPVVTPADLRRAEEVFADYIGKTLQIDLADLSTGTWSITPQAGDFITEIRTRRFGSLTYTRSGGEAEDVSLFDRERRRNISVYASTEKLAQRGRFYSEDDMVDYDILAHEIDATYSPERLFMEGTARVKVKIRSPAASTIALRLAESLVVRSVYTESHGRVLHLRVIGQNTLLVNFPGYILGGTELWLTIQYAGRVQPQELDREAIAVTQEAQETIAIQPEPRLLYSHRAYWYPQSSVSDYATAKLTMTLPSEYDVVATGVPVKSTNHRSRRVSVFQTERPVRYLAFVVSRLRDVDQREVEGVRIAFEANPRQVGYARSVISRTEDIFRFYTSLLTRSPYPSFTVAVTERATPGGHSPPYFAVVDQPVQLGSTPWRNDPVSFENYPDFFLAHEIAHQWWGQAVGWKNYHEQWLSEGFAQYFAALYAERKLNRRTYLSVIRQMNRTAVAESAQGPVYLGYRLGHIKRETAVFRSVVYNKSAMVLHMLRRRMGDDAFFAGLRAYYQDWEFKKAGTGDFQRAMERASGLDLTEFFEAWIFGQAIPTVSFSHRIENGELLLRFEQKGEPVDIPIAVTLTDRAGTATDVVVQLSERVTEHRIPWKGRLRSAAANADYGALVHIVR
jgi:hypothetical protein